MKCPFFVCFDRPYFPPSVYTYPNHCGISTLSSGSSSIPVISSLWPYENPRFLCFKRPSCAVSVTAACFGVSW